LFKIQTILAVFATISSILFVWHKILNKKIDLKNYRLYISLISLMIISLLNYFNVNAYIRITIITLFLIIFFKFLFKENIKLSIITPIFVQLIYMISEMIFAIIISFIFNVNNEDIVNSFFGTLIPNLAIAIISMIIVYIPFVRKLYNLILAKINKIGEIYLIFICFIFIIIANILVAFLYFEVEFRYLLIFNTIVTLFCFCIVIYMFKTKNNFIEVNEKYNTTINSLKEYEEILDRYRISNHENKNQLLTIRNLIPKSNKKVITYIDTLIENKLEDNDKVMFETSKIPSGGLRGLLYSKLLLMKELKIDYNLQVSKNIKTVDLIKNIDDYTMLDICKIVGVFVDNAIQEVKTLRKKNISIEMYFDKNELVVSISNNYGGTINIAKIDNNGYTTKGKNHGYGLALVKELINKNSRLNNERVLSKTIFTQILKIKM